MKLRVWVWINCPKFSCFYCRCIEKLFSICCVPNKVHFILTCRKDTKRHQLVRKDDIVIIEYQYQWSPATFK